jgi:hypothetical protein
LAPVRLLGCGRDAIVVRFWNDGESHPDVTEKCPFVSCSELTVNPKEEAVPEEICVKASWKY